MGDAALSFVNPRLWPLLLVAALPLVLHLLDRRRARRVDWPAVRFFLTQRRSRLRAIRFREALLIALRTLVVVALALAFLRPATQETVMSTGVERTTRRGIVLVVDTSASMANLHGDPPVSSLARAASEARRLIERLRPDDPLALSSGALEIVPAGESLDTPSDALAWLDALRAAGAGFDLAAAVEHGLERAERLTTNARGVFVLTDLQRADRDTVAPWAFIAQRWRDVVPRADLVVVDCGAAAPRNYRVTATSPGELLVSTRDPVQVHARAEADDAAADGAEQRELRVRLIVDAEPVAEATIALERGASSDAPSAAGAELACRFARGGEHRVVVEIAGRRDAGALDGLAIDDRRHLVVDVADRIDVLILEAPLDESRDESSRFVDLALLPSGGDLAASASVFRPRRASIALPGAFENARVVVLADVPRVPLENAAHLEDWVRAGGGLLVFAGDRVDPDDAARTLVRHGSGLLPCGLVARGAPADGAPPRILDADLAHPALAVFAPPEAGDLRRIAVRGWWKTSPLLAGARVLARLGDGAPWIVERAFGAGRVVLVTTSATPAGSDLPRTPLFVPLVHALSRYLAANDRARPAVFQGAPLEVALDAAETPRAVNVSSPSRPNAPVAYDVFDDGRRRRVVCRDTTRTGFYEFQIDSGALGGRTLTCAVDVDPRESDLRRITLTDLDPLREALGLRVVDRAPPEDGARSVATRPVERWPLCIALALAMLVLELALLARFARERAPWRPEAAR